MKNESNHRVKKGFFACLNCYEEAFSSLEE
jgi:hypothetical protein